MKKKRDKWLSFEEARDLIASRTGMSKAAAANDLGEKIANGALPFRAAVPTEITIKGIEVLMGEWILIGKAIGRIMEERSVTEEGAKSWLCGELGDKRMRWRAKEVLFGDRKLSEAEAQRYLRSQGGEYVPWRN